MSSPIAIPNSKASDLATPTSSYGSTASSRIVTYTREQLLALASSPLSQTPPESPTLRAFPEILAKNHGALFTAANAPITSSPVADPE